MKNPFPPLSKQSVLSTYFPWIAWGAFFQTVLFYLWLPMGDYDLWWHLAAGREMVTTRAWLHHEIFSHTRAGAPWINFEWLGQVLFYGLVSWGGWPLLYVGKVLVGISICFLLGTALKEVGAQGSFLALVGWTGFFGMAMRWDARMEMFTLFLLIAYVVLIVRLRTGSSRYRRGFPWVIAALQCLWCNVHGGFVLGGGLLFLVSVGAKWAREDSRVQAALDRAVVTALVASLCNPYGPQLLWVHLEHAFQLAGADRVIQEWQPVSLREMPFFWVLFFSSAFLLVDGLVRQRLSVRFWAPAVVAFAWWGSTALRNTAVSSLVLSVFIAEQGARFYRDRRYQRGCWVAALVILGFHGLRPINIRDLRLVSWNRFPQKASAFLKQHHLKGPLFNTYELGGYLEWDVGRSLPVFQDGRYLFNELVAEQVRLNDGLYQGTDVRGWERYFERYNINVAVVRYPGFDIPRRVHGQIVRLSPALFQFDRSQWALVFWDDVALIYLKRTDQNASFIARHDYRIYPEDPGLTALLIQERRLSKEDVQADLRRHQTEVGPSAVRNFLEAALLT